MCMRVHMYVCFVFFFVGRASSRTRAQVFASASADKTVAVWDLRKKNGSMLSLEAHEEDVNVISWNRNVTYLLASGSDDGSFKIWDLRAFGSGEPVAQFRWHKVRPPCPAQPGPAPRCLDPIILFSRVFSRGCWFCSLASNDLAGERDHIGAWFWRSGSRFPYLRIMNSVLVPAITFLLPTCVPVETLIHRFTEN